MTKSENEKEQENNPDIGKEVLRGIVKLPVDEVIVLPLEQVEQRIILLGLGRDDLHKFDVESFSYSCIGSMLSQNEDQSATLVYLLFEIAGVLSPKKEETKKEKKKKWNRKKKKKKDKKRFWW
jgi:hypothetical protein